jgi:serine/threonine protein kinase/Tol biopolymer transport system component
VPIQPGTTVARYRIEEKLGEGGMGVVWRATDTTLHRTVALKLLPEAFARDPERVARFEREARMLAALNHPNIAAIYGLESDGPLRFLAMEYVPGETLSDRLVRGALPVPEAIAIARRIADALESAHEKGVVHRDLKPSNVQLTPDGDVKLLDFGLARAFAPDGATSSLPDESPTISAVMTRGDVILGTAAYMSPEQARGRLVDRRSDIWSFGLVLFEMLTGRRVFEGETTSDLLAAVLRQDIPWDRLPSDTPPHVRVLLERCLTRDPRERLRDIGEARIALTSSPAEPKPAARTSPVLLRWGVPALAALLAAALVWIVARRAAPPAAIGPTRTLELASLSDPKYSSPALSPDGNSITYVDKGQLWVRDLGQLDARSLVTDGDARHPFWSPDAKTIGYLSGTRVMRVPAAGGAAETIAEFQAGFGFGGEGGVWDEQGHVIVTQGMANGLIEIPEHGGETRTLLAADTTKEGDFHEPSLLPGARGMLVVTHRKQGIDNISLVRQGKVTTLLVLPEQTLARPQYSPTGHIVFERTSPPAGVWAVPFSLSQLRTTGEPFLVAAGGLQPSVARDGSLVYISPAPQKLEFCWVDREGAVVQHLAELGPSLEDGGVFALSPDGGRVVVTLGTGADLWVYDFARGSRMRLTNSPGLEVNGFFTSDGRQIVYQALPRLNPVLSNWCLIRQNADGSGPPDTLVRGGALTPSISPDGRTLFYTLITSESGWTIESRPFGMAGSPVQLTDGRQVAYFPRPSPDGRWIVYCVNDILPNGHPQVVLQSLVTGTKTVIGTGLWPKWDTRGDRLYFVRRDDMMEVKVGKGDPPITEPAVRLFTRPTVELPMVFDWTPQFAVRGDRFLVLRPLDETRPTSVVLVQNWLAEFRSGKR